MSIHWPITRRLAARARATVVVDDRRRWRGVELLLGAMRLADEIERRSQSPMLGVMLPTSGLSPMAFLAGWMLGRTVVPLNYLLKPAELQYVVDDCAADAVVTVGPMLDFLERPPTGVDMIRLDEMSFRGAPSFRWPSLHGVFTPADDLAALLYTSGTSGRPKGVMLTHANLSANIRQATRKAGFTTDDVLLGVLPQFHSFGFTVLTLLPLTIGCRVVYAARFQPSLMLRLLREHRPTVFVAIPSMYAALLAAKNATPEDFASLRLAVSGGEPLPAAVFNGFRERFGVTLNEGYGLTETAPVTNVCTPEEFRLRSVGTPLPGVRERITDEDGRDLPPNTDGEVRIAGPNVMRGYYKLPEETAGVFDDRGYFRTGDMGRMDEDGHLYITGRIKEMIIVGGENVFPREIEEVLNMHPAVEASGVVGLRDDVRGELPIAFVEFKEGVVASESELRAWCRERLAGYKIPREVRILETIPRGPTGKVMRRELQTML